MEQLIEKYQRKLSATPTGFTRSLLPQIDWQAQLVGIRGARGVGKTTLLLQYLHQHHLNDPGALYLSLDDLWFATHRLVDLADIFVKYGGKHLFLDEVHKYPEWSREIKNIYDSYPELKVVFTGSSLLEILNARADLSRRALSYQMQGLSFREYLGLELSQHFPILTLEEIIANHPEISRRIVKEIKPLPHFQNYLQHGYYPFFREGKAHYEARLEEVVNFILEVELPILRGIGTAHIHKLKQLLLVIAESAPFTPNITKLGERIGVARNTLLQYLHALQEAGLTLHLHRHGKGISRLQKPDKLFLENSNLAVTLATSQADAGSIRESFLYNQLAYLHQVESPQDGGDFLVDRIWRFEVGGKGKSTRQIARHKNAFVAAAEIEYGSLKQIPLWLFGFLY